MSKRAIELPEQGAASKKAKVPKTGIDMVVHIIRDLQKAGGCSRQAILKRAVEEGMERLQNAKFLNKILIDGVKKGVLAQNKASYLVAGDPVIEEEQGPTIEIKEMKEGSGDRTVENGDSIVISYKGTLASNGTKFDSGKRFDFTCGNKDVIKGMDAGVLGMSVGQRRIITIPWSLGYGKRGSSPDIPPEADLVFDILLLEFS